MKAIVSTKYGAPDVLQLKEIEKPVPKNNEVLIRVYATSVNYGDLLARNLKIVTRKQFNMPFLFLIMAKFFFGLQKPKVTILGSEFAGEIEATGKGVKLFKPGDQVFGYLGQNMGTYSEYICMSEKGVLSIKPTNMTFEEAAVVVYGSLMAMPLLRKMDIQKGQKVLINGASGSIGSAAVQIAKYYGAEVTGVCGTQRLEYVKALGADKVIDYTREDFTKSGETYDLIVDILGKSSFLHCKKSLKQKGCYLLVSFKTKQLLQMAWTSMVGNKRVICGLAPGSVSDLLSVKQLMEAGKIKAVIDRSFLFEQTADAHRYVETGERRGNVVITLAKSTN
jgi:NADPH:quinone reductase-like Zn-dependent oxidoreductase